MEYLPRHVKDALDEGFTITHKGLLCWAPIPNVVAAFSMRVLFLALESVFSVAFWAMHSKTRTYNMPQHLCPWEIASTDYDGCCSHVAIGEGVAGQDTQHLTAEELEAKHAAALQRASEQKKANYYGAKNSNFAEWKATRRRYEAKRDLVEKRASGSASKRKAKAEGRFKCTTCGLPFESSTNLNEHYLTKRHIDKVKGIPPKIAKCPEYDVWAKANIAAKKHHCKVCDFTTSTAQKLNSHFSSQRHKKRAAAAVSGSSS
jgi:hypothetical protein